VIIDYLLSKDGLRLDEVDVTLAGVRLGRGPGGFVAQSASEITGTLRVTLADLSAAIARPEVIDQLLLGVPGIARPEVTFGSSAASKHSAGVSRSPRPRTSALQPTGSSCLRCGWRACR
jgi:hypothetical protein